MSNINLDEIRRKPLLSLEEAAALVGKKVRTIKDWRRGYYINKVKRWYFEDRRKLVGTVNPQAGRFNRWAIWRTDLLDFAQAIEETLRQNHQIIRFKHKPPSFKSVKSKDTIDIRSV